jgi:hypothetical protein
VDELGDPEVRAEISALYGLTPGDFVAARDVRVRELRVAGDTERAAAVRALRRPTVDVWSVNQVARAHRDRVEALVDAGTALAAAQLDGDPPAVRDATRRRRALLAELADAAVEFAGALGGTASSHRDGVAALLDAASLDPEMQPVLIEGCLTRAVPRPSGFGTGGWEPGARDRGDRGTSVAPEPRAPRRGHDELAVKRAQAARADASELARAARDALDSARAAEQEAQSALETATRHVDDLTRALDAAREAVRDAKQRATGAARDSIAARTAERRAAARLTRAQQAVADASPPA